MSEEEDRIPCPHPIAFRGGADCHLCGNSGIVLPGSPWEPPLVSIPAPDDESVPRPRGSHGNRPEPRGRALGRVD